MRIALLGLLLVAACASHTDSGSDPEDTDTDTDTAATLRGVDLSDWTYATEEPASGEAAQMVFVFGADTGDGTMDGHWTEFVRHARSGEILCATTWRVASTSTIAGSECDALWAVDWELPSSPGGDYCQAVYGYDPLSKNLDFYEAIGHYQPAGTDAELCVQEEGSSTERIEGYTMMEFDSAGFVLRAQDAFTIE